MKYDIKKLKADIARREEAIREHKEGYRRYGRPPYAEAAELWGKKTHLNQRDHAALRPQVTRLYMIRAELRGRVHCQGMTAQEQTEAVRPYKILYELAEEQPSVAEG